MNITNIKNQIQKFLGTMNIDVLEMSYVPGKLIMDHDSTTGEDYEMLTDDTMNVIINKNLPSDESQQQKIWEFETYLYITYHNICLNYEVKH